MRNPMRTMCATTLVLEALAVLFAALVLNRLPPEYVGGDLDPGRALAAVGGLALALLLCAGILRWRLGYVVGSLLQVVVLAVGFWLPMMFVVGLMFLALWVASVWVGLIIQRDRAAAAAAEGADDAAPAG